MIHLQVSDSLEFSPRVRQFYIMERCRAYPGIINNRTIFVVLKVNKHDHGYFNYQWSIRKIYYVLIFLCCLYPKCLSNFCFLTLFLPPKHRQQIQNLTNVTPLIWTTFVLQRPRSVKWKNVSGARFCGMTWTIDIIHTSQDWSQDQGAVVVGPRWGPYSWEKPKKFLCLLDH